MPKNVRELLRVGAPAKVKMLTAMLAHLHPADLDVATIRQHAGSFLIERPIEDLDYVADAEIVSNDDVEQGPPS